MNRGIVNVQTIRVLTMAPVLIMKASLVNVWMDIQVCHVMTDLSNI